MTAPTSTKRGRQLGRTTDEALAVIAEWVPNLDVDPDWVYAGNKVKVNGTCRVHGESVSPRFYNLRKGQGIGCRGCCPRGRQLGCTTEEALAELAEWAPNLDVDPDWVYAGVRAEVNGTCNVHGDHVSPRFSGIRQGRGIGCGRCRPRGRPLGCTTEEALAVIAENVPHLDVDPDWVYAGTKAKVVGTCNVHGEDVSPRFEHLRNGRGIGCRGCSLGRTTEEALAELAEWAPNLDVDPDWVYAGVEAEVNGTCNVHGGRVSPRFNSLQKGWGIGCRGCMPRSYGALRSKAATHPVPPGAD